MSLCFLCHFFLPICPKLHSCSGRVWLTFTSSVLAPPSLGSTLDHWPYGSTGLPCPSGSTLIRRRLTYTPLPCKPSACVPSLHPYGSVWLHLLCAVSPFLWLRMAPPSLRLHLGPQLHRLNLRCSSLRLRLGLQDHQCHLIPSACRAPLSLASSPSVIPLVSSAKSPPLLLPPSIPSFILAALWISAWLLLLFTHTWLLPPSMSPWFLPPQSPLNSWPLPQPLVLRAPTHPPQFDFDFH